MGREARAKKDRICQWCKSTHSMTADEFSDHHMVKFKAHIDANVRKNGEARRSRTMA